MQIIPVWCNKIHLCHNRPSCLAPLCHDVGESVQRIVGEFLEAILIVGQLKLNEELNHINLFH
mgnify:CR=1 FL=1